MGGGIHGTPLQFQHFTASIVVNVSTVPISRFDTHTAQFADSALSHPHLTISHPTLTPPAMASPLTPRIAPAHNDARAMASPPSSPPDTVTNEDRAKPDEVLRVLSPLRPRRTPVLVNAPVVSWHLGASSLRPLPSFDSVLSDSVLSATSGLSEMSSVGSTVRALRGALRALSGEEESGRGGSAQNLLAEGEERDAALLLHGEGVQMGSLEEDAALLPQREGGQRNGWGESAPLFLHSAALQTATWEGEAPLPPPHSFAPTSFSVAVTDLGVDGEEQASFHSSSPEYEDEEDEDEERNKEERESGEEKEASPLAKPPPTSKAALEVDGDADGWTPHFLSPVTEVTEPGLSRGASLSGMSLFSLGRGVEVGVARRVRFAAVGNGNGSGNGYGGNRGGGGQVWDEEGEKLSGGGSGSGRVGDRSEGSGRVVRRRPAFRAANRDDEDTTSRSHENDVALPHTKHEKGGGRLHPTTPLPRPSAEAGSNTIQTPASHTPNGQTANGEKPVDAGREEGKSGLRGFCVKFRLDKVREKAGRLRQRLKGRVGRMVAVRVLGRVL